MNEWYEFKRLIKGEKSVVYEAEQEKLYSLMVAHDVETLFYDIYENINVDIAKRIELQKQLNNDYYNVLFQGAKGVFQSLNRSGVEYALIKGLFFALKAYGDLTLRSSTDIDILIDSEDYPQLKKILLKEGFVQGYYDDGKIIESSSETKLYYAINTHQTSPFVKLSYVNKNIKSINIDVNLKVTGSEFENIEICTKDLLKNRTNIKFDNFNISVLNNENALLAHCLNIYKDNNSIIMLMHDKGYRGRQLCDIYFFCRKNKIDWKYILEKALSYGIYEQIYQIVYLTSVFFDDFSLVRKMNASAYYPKSLDYFGMKSYEKKLWNMSLSERLSNLKLSDVVYSKLTEQDISKIIINEKYINL